MLPKSVATLCYRAMLLQYHYYTITLSLYYYNIIYYTITILHYYNIIGYNPYALPFIPMMYLFPN